jgi:2-alkenal reductase
MPLNKGKFLAAIMLLMLAALACSANDLVPVEDLPSTPMIATATKAASAATATLVPVAAAPTVSPPSAASPAVIDSSDQVYIDLYKRVSNAIVFIRIYNNAGRSLGTGSGFVIDSKGYVVTNNHVVRGAADIEVAFTSGLKTRGKVLGTDATADIAVIKVEVPAEKLTVVSLGDSEKVQVGQRVIAIGNPFGLRSSMSLGIISGLGRTLQGDSQTTAGASFSAPDIIQTDAAINPGNSGGPLLNLKGEVIGVNKAIVSQTGENSGVGFAVSSNTVKKIIPSLISEGKYVYPYLGVTSTEDLSLREVELLNLPRTTGVYITSVVPGGPADRAGLKAGSRNTSAQGVVAGGDLVIAIDGVEVKTFSELMSYLVNKTSVGQTVKLTLLRDGKQMDVNVTLTARPNQ